MIDDTNRRIKALTIKINTIEHLVQKIYDRLDKVK